MFGTARLLSILVTTFHTPVVLPTLSEMPPRATLVSAAPLSPHQVLAHQQLRCSNQRTPATLDASTPQSAKPRVRRTAEQREASAPDCLSKSPRAAPPCFARASHLHVPPALSFSRVITASFPSSQTATPAQSVSSAAMHRHNAQLHANAAASSTDQPSAPFTPRPQRQPLLLSSPTTAMLSAARLFSRPIVPLQPVPTSSPAAHTLTPTSQSSAVPATRKVPASPHQDQCRHIRRSSSSSSSTPTATRHPRSRACCKELQQALELEWGCQYRLKPSQLTAGVEQYLAKVPGINLRTRAAGLRDAVGLEVAVAMVHSHPRLLATVAPSDVVKRLAALAGVFDAEPASIVALVSKKPGAAALLESALLPESVEARVKTLCAALRVGRKKLLAMCTKNARVLSADHRGMVSRLASLADGLGLTPEQVIDMCKRSPSSLSVLPSNAAEVCTAVAAALEVERSEAAQLCFNNPSLLTKQPAKVAEVARWLKQHLGLTCWDLDRYVVRLRSLLHQFCIAILYCLHISRQIISGWSPSTQGLSMSFPA
jgi:hypothetical protein